MGNFLKSSYQLFVNHLQQVARATKFLYYGT